MRAHRWDVPPRGHWRAIARRVIETIADECANLDPAYTLSRIDASYPFGERAHLPYKTWLDERRRIRVQLGLLDDPRVFGCHAPRVQQVAAGQRELALS